MVLRLLEERDRERHVLLLKTYTMLETWKFQLTSGVVTVWPVVNPNTQQRQKMFGLGALPLNRCPPILLPSTKIKQF